MRYTIFIQSIANTYIYNVIWLPIRRFFFSCALLMSIYRPHSSDLSWTQLEDNFMPFVTCHAFSSCAATPTSKKIEQCFQAA